MSVRGGTVGASAMGLLEVLFPPRCAGCGRGPWPFCGRCRAGLSPLSPPWCRRCGLPLGTEVERCPRCPPPPIVRARAAFAYEGPARAAVHRLKFSGHRRVGEALAPAMAAVAEPTPDVIAWVPLSRRRRAARGYDQAEVLARSVGRALGVPVVGLLVRVEETAPQARRPVVERRGAMRGAFRAVRDPPASVLLVDDVLTTGATAAACAHALVEAGAREVGVLTAARALPGPLPARLYSGRGFPSGSVVARGKAPR